MQLYTQIQTKGVITIPATIRKKLGLDQSDLLKVTADSGKIIMEPVRVLPYPTRKYSGGEVDDFLASDKDEI